MLNAGIIYRLGLHDPAVWPVAAIAAMPCMLCVVVGMHYLTKSREVCWDKSHPEQYRDSISYSEDTKLGFFRRMRYSAMQVFPHLNEQMSRPRVFTESRNKQQDLQEHFGTCRAMFANHGVAFVDGLEGKRV